MGTARIRTGLEGRTDPAKVDAATEADIALLRMPDRVPETTPRVLT